MKQLLIVLALLSCGCLHGAAVTAAVGPQFGVDGGTGVVATFEFTRIQHTEKSSGRDGTGGNMLGVGFTGQAIGGWESTDGSFGGGAVAVDYLPYLGDWGFVNFGGGVGAALGDAGFGLLLVMPRLGFAITPWESGGGQWGLGGRLHCQFALNGAKLCGPALTLTQTYLTD